MRLGRGVTLPSGSVVELRHMPFPVEFIAYPMQTKPGWWRIKVMYVGRDRESNGKTRFWGGSFVCDAFGKTLKRAGKGEEVLIVPVDLSHSDMVREGWRFFYNRRPEMYKKLVE